MGMKTQKMVVIYQTTVPIGMKEDLMAVFYANPRKMKFQTLGFDFLVCLGSQNLEKKLNGESSHVSFVGDLIVVPGFGSKKFSLCFCIAWNVIFDSGLKYIARSFFTSNEIRIIESRREKMRYS